MGRYWKLLGEYDAETTTYTALAGGAGASPYYPEEPANLIGLRAIPNRSAASTLMNHVSFKLTCTCFKPNAIEVGAQGTGLQTAPALQQGSMDWEVHQPVQVGVKIVIEGKNVTADTPVSVSCLLYGLFES